MLNCRRSFRVFAVRVISAFPVNSSKMRTTSYSAPVVSNSNLANSPWITWGKLMTLICSSSSEMRRNFDSSTSVKLVLCATVFERHLQYGICLILLVNLTGLNNCLKLDQPLSLTDVSRRLSSVEMSKRCLMLTRELLVPRQFCSVMIAREFCLMCFEAFLLVLLVTAAISSFLGSLNSSDVFLYSNSAASHPQCRGSSHQQAASIHPALHRADWHTVGHTL